VRLLFIHQNFPGQYRHIAPYMAARGHESTGLGEKANVLRQKPNLPGVRLLGYESAPLDPSKIIPFTASVQRAIHRGRVVARGATKLAKSGYKPDVVFAHIGWGEALFLKDVFPEAKVILYCEFFYRNKGSDYGFDPEFPPSPEGLQRLRVMNAPLQMSLEASDWGLAPTRWQHEHFPAGYKERISVIHDGIDTDIVKPDPAAKFKVPGEGGPTYSRDDEIITYLSRNLEPYRGFHIFMRAVPEILKRRPKAKIIIVGADEISYSAKLPQGQTYRKRALAEMEGKIDFSRVHMIPWLPYGDYLNMLRISRAHVYLTYPFVLSWSLLESMAAGCLVIGSRTPPVEEVMVDGVNGLLTDFFNPAEIAERIAYAVEKGPELQPLREAARKMVVERFDLKTICLPAQQRMVTDLASGRTPQA
jgi:glycosyltransferase involved in cell wall biosynthesis